MVAEVARRGRRLGGGSRRKEQREAWKKGLSYWGALTGTQEEVGGSGGYVTSLQVGCKTERDRELMPTTRGCDTGERVGLVGLGT